MMAAEPIFNRVDQVAVVVRDLDAAVAEYTRCLGVGPWWVGTYAPPKLTDMWIRGEAVAYSMRIALAWTGETLWELIQPLDGPSIYKEFLEAHGEGLHHVQLAYGEMAYEALLQTLAERGCPSLMEGTFCGLHFAYFDTEGPLKTIVEVRHAPETWVRPEPDYWYPEAPARPRLSR